MAYTPAPLNNAAQLQKSPGLGSFLKTNVASPVDERKIDYSPKEIQFLRELKKKGVGMQEAFSFIEKKRLEDPKYFQQQQMKPAKDFLGSAVAKVPQFLGNMLGEAGERSAQSVESGRQTMGRNIGAPVPVNPISPQQVGQQIRDIGTQGRQNLEGKLGVDPTSTASSFGRGTSSLGLTYLLGKTSGLNRGISTAFEGVKNAPTLAKAVPQIGTLGTLGGIENMAFAKGDTGKADTTDFGFGFIGSNVFAALPFAKKIISKIPVPSMIKNIARRLEVSGAMNPAKYDQLKKTLMEEGVDLSSELPKDDVYGLSDWMLKRNIEGEIPEQINTLRQISKDSQSAKKAVLNQSDTLHQDQYTKNLLDDLAEELKDSRSPERQEMFVKVTNWIKQWENGGLRLTDIDDVRGMGWDVLNPFTSSGAVRIAQQDLRGVISAVKRYIEKQADIEELGKSLGYQGKNLIRDLNNQTQMAYGIAEAMARKESTSLSQSILSFFASRSISTGLGALVGWSTDVGPFDTNTLGGKVGNALLGAIIGTFGGSPAIKTKVANWLDNLSGKQKSQVYEWIKSKGTKYNIEVEKQLNKLEKSLDFKNKNAITGKPISQSLSNPTASSVPASQGGNILNSNIDTSLGAPAITKQPEGLVPLQKQSLTNQQTIIQQGKAPGKAKLSNIETQNGIGLSNIDAGISDIKIHGDEGDILYISKVIESGIAKGKSSQEIKEQVIRYIANKEGLKEMTTVGKEGLGNFIEKSASGEITETLENYAKNRALKDAPATVEGVIPRSLPGFIGEKKGLPVKETTPPPKKQGKTLKPQQKQAVLEGEKVGENTKIEDNLLQEARKYKSAEEFEKVLQKEGKVIGEGNSGRVYEMGGYVYKNDTANEGKILDIMRGSDNIVGGETVNGKVKLQKAKRVLSIDDIKDEFNRYSMGETYIDNNAFGKLNRGVSEISNNLIHYGDQMQVGVFDDGLKILDFSISRKTADNTFSYNNLYDNLDALGKRYSDFGVGGYKDILNDGKSISRMFNSFAKKGSIDDITKGDYAEQLGKQGYEAVEKAFKEGFDGDYIYYARDARPVMIEGTYKIPTKNRSMLLSKNKLTDSQIKNWELQPIIEIERKPESQLRKIREQANKKGLPPKQQITQKNKQVIDEIQKKLDSFVADKDSRDSDLEQKQKYARVLVNDYNLDEKSRRYVVDSIWGRNRMHRGDITKVVGRSLRKTTSNQTNTGNKSKDKMRSTRD